MSEYAYTVGMIHSLVRCSLIIYVLTVAFALSFACDTARATDVRWSDPLLARDAGGCSVTFDVEWRNAWRNERNHDAVWICVRLSHAGLDAGPARLVPGAAIKIIDAGGIAGEVVVSADGMGAFVRPAGPCRGDVRWNVQLTLDESSARFLGENAGSTVSVYAFEMVYIPSGPFTLGDPGEDSVGYAAFFRSDAQGKRAGLYHVPDESEIPVGPAEGSLYYNHSQRFSIYEGDRLGPLPEAFPKGTRDFYIMKYEITQGEYVTFLNSLSAAAQTSRTLAGARGYAENRGTIKAENGEHIAGAPSRPANFVSWDDGCAFADWAGMRPMTELEYTKACRGPLEPLANEYPWNTDSKGELLRVMTDSGDLARSGNADESRMNEANRHQFGATFYWVMDMAGSVWERCVTIGHPKGRAFLGTHGDGRLTDAGFATNADWPAGDDEGGGYGYRGGGHYEKTRNFEPRDFNPYSPIGWRRYGSWGGAPRSVAYGFRCVRSAP